MQMLRDHLLWLRHAQGGGHACLTFHEPRGICRLPHILASGGCQKA